ncbi:unnamed protein product [Fusarium equiseti]|uniref:NAD dependent epimerase/dehydratase n=1 Tax=Fusarium equiseti TaxID=61235 RepID=A0A8J2NIX9_FUSEQ|nr:unnamed protein product [Fusarium equiseti]
MATSNVLGVGPQTVVQPHRTYGERTVPMKVLCLGYGRTGTRSLRDQLLTLGFHHSYHTFDAIYRDFYDCKLWMDLLEAKYDRGEKPSREDFDKLLGHCQAVLDMPAAYFAEELIEYYPDAKVILTIRDPESWATSQRNSIMKADKGILPPILAFTARLLRMPNRWTEPMFKKLRQILYDSDFDRNGINAMEQHYAKVRSLVPKERLLEYHVSDGWEPLCEFLDKPVPKEATPHINKSSAFAQKHRSRLLATIMGQFRRLLDISAYVSLITVVVTVGFSMSPVFWQ